MVDDPPLFLDDAAELESNPEEDVVENSEHDTTSELGFLSDDDGDSDSIDDTDEDPDYVLSTSSDDAAGASGAGAAGASGAGAAGPPAAKRRRPDSPDDSDDVDTPPALSIFYGAPDRTKWYSEPKPFSKSMMRPDPNLGPETTIQGRAGRSPTNSWQLMFPRSRRSWTIRIKRSKSSSPATRENGMPRRPTTQRSWQSSAC